MKKYKNFTVDIMGRKTKVYFINSDKIKSPPLYSKNDEAIGTFTLSNQEIFLNSNINFDSVKSTFLHEIIESVNYLCELNLPHEKITTLETGIYSAIQKKWNPFN